MRPARRSSSAVNPARCEAKRNVVTEEGTMRLVDFDPVARVYQPLERLVFGMALDRVRWACLDALPEQGEVLLLGDGDGRYLEAASRVKTRLRFLSVDSSAMMLRRASERLTLDQRERVEFVHAPVEEWLAANAFPPAGRCDMVVTQFFLDCFPQPELEALASEMVSLLRPGGHWVVAEFRQPVGSRCCRWGGKALLALMYCFFRLTTGLRAQRLPDHVRALRRAGMVPSATRQYSARLGCITSEVWRVPS